MYDYMRTLKRRISYILLICLFLTIAILSFVYIAVQQDAAAEDTSSYQFDVIGCLDDIRVVVIKVENTVTHVKYVVASPVESCE